jgi:hypothetical protein
MGSSVRARICEWQSDLRQRVGVFLKRVPAAVSVMDGPLAVAGQTLSKLLRDLSVQEPVNQSVPEAMRCFIDTKEYIEQVGDGLWKDQKLRSKRRRLTLTGRPQSGSWDNQADNRTLLSGSSAVFTIAR